MEGKDKDNMSGQFAPSVLIVMWKLKMKMVGKDRVSCTLDSNRKQPNLYHHPTFPFSSILISRSIWPFWQLGTEVMHDYDINFFE